MAASEIGLPRRSQANRWTVAHRQTDRQTDTLICVTFPFRTRTYVYMAFVHICKLTFLMSLLPPPSSAYLAKAQQPQECLHYSCVSVTGATLHKCIRFHFPSEHSLSSSRMATTVCSLSLLSTVLQVTKRSVQGWSHH